MTFKYLTLCLTSFYFLSAFPQSIHAAEGSSQNEIHDGIVQLFRTPYNNYNAKREYQEVCKRLDRVITSFKSINIVPLKALDTGLESITMFCALPDQFIKFVHSRDDVPPSTRMNRMRADGKDPQYNCDFWYDLKYSKNNSFINQGISLGHCSFSVPDLSVGIWGYKDSTTSQVLATHNTAVFQINITRGREGLNRGLDNVVLKKLVEGFYIVIHEDSQQVDWQNTPDVADKFKESQKSYRYEWEIKN